MELLIRGSAKPDAEGHVQFITRNPRPQFR